MSHQVKKLLECHIIMYNSKRPLTQWIHETHYLLFSEWNGRLEIKDLRGEMRRDFQNIKDLIVNGNTSEKEDE